MKKLEDTFEQTLVHEEQQLSTEDTGNPTPEDTFSLQKALRDLKIKHEVYILLFNCNTPKLSYLD